MSWRVGVLTVEEVTPAPAPDREMVAVVRASYERELAEPFLPVSAEEIVAGVLDTAPESFAEPRAPLSQLCEEAGLERRGTDYAHEESVWANARMVSHVAVLGELLDSPEQWAAACLALEAFEAAERSPAMLQKALQALRDPDVLVPVAEVLLDVDSDPEQFSGVDSFAADLARSARRPAHAAPGHWLRAVVSERRRDPLAAQAHLEIAVDADPTWAPAIDRLAWYRSDQGDAVGAVRLWQRLGIRPEDHDDLREVLPFAVLGDVKLARNQACWCGSGRKFKHCHLNRPPTPALPDRVGWLCRKAVAYLRRRGIGAAEHIAELALARADGDSSEQAMERVLADPLLLDVAMHEGGWFELFLDERAALLPEDEALLARAWTLVDRTLCEVVQTRPGEGLTVRDLRSAQLIEVRERTFSQEAWPGQVVCCRPVPDGEGHQFIGGLFTVDPGREKEVFALLDDRDGEGLLAWVAATERPPRLQTREGEPLLACTATVEVPDVDAARPVLDRLFSPDGDAGWTEAHELPNGEVILRAMIRLDGSLLQVETLSSDRAHRVLATLTAEIPGARVVSDERRAVDPTSRSADPAPAPSPVPLDDPEVRRAVEQYIKEFEARWCDEPIPALDGLTPRQAAADPTRRESLERLLTSYERFAVPGEPGFAVQDPDRLRRLLGPELAD
ncbi:MAG: SEC-C domain-containing protein [Mycobacteriales bacterium]